MSAAVLAIETSTTHGSVAVCREQEIVFAAAFASNRSHHSQLFGPLRSALDACGDELARIVVGTGPGSYTGARIGIAAAQGIAIARRVPAFGLLSVLAPEVPELPRAFVVCGDARRGKFFVARVRDELLHGEIALHPAGELAQLHAQDAGVPWLTFDPKPPLDLVSITLSKPSASRLALLASLLPDETICRLEQQSLEPHYLAAPFVTKPGG